MNLKKPSSPGRTWCGPPIVAVLLAAAMVLATGPPARATTFTLDDNPSLWGGSGLGAEDPFGTTGRVASGGLAPSPALGTYGFTGGDMLGPGPVRRMGSPDGPYIDAISDNTRYLGDVLIDFSVDRVSTGLAGTAVATEAAAADQPGDIFRTTRGFAAPGAFAGTLSGTGYLGPLPTAGGGGSNRRILDESNDLGLAAPATMNQGSHDNVDGFDWSDVFGATVDPGKGLPAPSDWIYFAIAPDNAWGGSAADVFACAPGTALASPTPFAPATTLGLDSMTAENIDDLDALVLWDSRTAGDVGSLDAGIDYALFSLGPGSASLGGSLTGGDVFFTDFNGSFALYADAGDLGLLSGELTDNVDALEVVPEPVTLAGLMLGIGTLGRYVRRRRRA